MEQNRILEHGGVQEKLSLRVEYDVHQYDKSLRTEGKITKTVSLGWRSFSCGKGMSIGEILDFQEKANALLQEIKNLMADGTYIKVCLTKSAHEDVPPFEIHDQFGAHECTLNQLQFECWTFEGSYLDGDPDDEESGLYLQPDTRYTDATWDLTLYWNQDILKSLAEAHL